MNKNSEKPVFPQWLRRLDPTLEAAESNAVFQAFLLRRRDHVEPGLAGYLRSWWKQQNTTKIFFTILCLIVAMISIKYLSFMEIVFAIGFLAGFILIMRQIKKKHTKLPYWVSDVFAPTGTVEPVAIDLWASGIKGSEIIEAIHLEIRQKEWLKLSIGFPLIIATSSIVYLSYRGFSLITISTLASAIWVSWLYFKHFHVYRSRMVRVVKLNPMVRKWSTVTEKSQRNTSIFGELNMLSPTLVHAILIAIAFMYSHFIITGLQRSSSDVFTDVTQYIAPDRSYIVEIIYMIAFIIIILKLNKDVKPDKNRHKAMNILLERGNFAFDCFMSHSILKDPNGVIWAQWTHQLMYDQHKYYWVKPHYRSYHWLLSSDKKRYLCPSENVIPNAPLEAWNKWEDFPISKLVMREVESFVQWHEKLLAQPPESRDIMEVKNFHRKEQELLKKLQDHLGPNYRFVFEKSVLE